MKCEGFSVECGKYRAIKYRMNTAYVDDDLNFKILCPKCQEESNDYWRDMWLQYYSMAL